MALHKTLLHLDVHYVDYLMYHSILYQFHTRVLNHHYRHYYHLQHNGNHAIRLMDIYVVLHLQMFPMLVRNRRQARHLHFPCEDVYHQNHLVVHYHLDMQDVPQTVWSNHLTNYQNPYNSLMYLVIQNYYDYNLYQPLAPRPHLLSIDLLLDHN